LAKNTYGIGGHFQKNTTPSLDEKLLSSCNSISDVITICIKNCKKYTFKKSGNTNQKKDKNP